MYYFRNKNLESSGPGYYPIIYPEKKFFTLKNKIPVLNLFSNICI